MLYSLLSSTLSVGWYTRVVGENIIAEISKYFEKSRNAPFCQSTLSRKGKEMVCENTGGNVTGATLARTIVYMIGHLTQLSSP